MGAGISLNGLGAFNWASVQKVLIGLVISSVVGFVLGFLATRLTEAVCKNFNRRKTEGFFSVGQIISASLMAFSHGAQDGQKFMGVLYLALVTGGVYTMAEGSVMNIPLWIMLMCSLIMALGTSVGGYRIIKSMGIDMVKLENIRASRRRWSPPEA
jgi:PiT family inorganic phosphate transporter